MKSQPSPSHRMFKTKLCKHWLSKNNCRYGDSCAFAHGKHELLQPKPKIRKMKKIVDDEDTTNETLSSSFLDDFVIL